MRVDSFSNKKRSLVVGDPANRRVTVDLLTGLWRFDHPTLLLRGQSDSQCRPEWQTSFAVPMASTPS
jgi:hypothetical protein